MKSHRIDKEIKIRIRNINKIDYENDLHMPDSW